MILGTPAYMAPEQARGERDLDGRVDLYATGMILYECLTGRLPFAARAVPALLAELQRSTPPRPRLLRVEVPHSLDAFVMKALARDRAERFPDATAMLRALQALGPFEDALDAPGDDPTEVSGPPTEAPKHDTPSQRVEIFARVK
jgi:serine/threonine-protein kinase